MTLRDVFEIPLVTTKTRFIIECGKVVRRGLWCQDHMLDMISRYKNAKVCEFVYNGKKNTVLVRLEVPE